MSLTDQETRAAATPIAEAPSRRRVVWMRPSTWPAYWPLWVLVAGYPLWWIVGISNLLPVALAVPFGIQLFRRRPVRLPSGSFWWALYLLWVVLGVAALWIDAPSGVPGGAMQRLPVFTVRLVWFVASTVVMLWAYNLPERDLPTGKVVRIVGWMFVVTTAGGLLGVVAPRLELTSLAQMVLPAELQSSNFVRGMIHPGVASIQTILGVEGGRPVAPFAFANSWGANLSMFLPFFLVGYCGRSAGWKRWPALAVVAAAIIPTVVSLNRGLWICLALGVAYLIVRTFLRGNAVLALVGVVALAGLLTLAVGSQLGTMVEERIAHPHSNERRGGLLEATVSDAASTSPVIGFGSTRDYRGSFASIAGGGTPDCPGCEVPPLGTQGQLWFVIFAQGLVGAAFFLLFFGNQARRHWRSRTAIESIGFAMLLFFFVQLFVYDTMDLPMMTVLLGVGLMERAHPASRSATIGEWGRWLRRAWRPLLLLSALGAAVGLGLGMSRPVRYAATIPIELQPVPVHLDLTGKADAKPTTIDTEASMVFSERALDQVATTTGGERPDRGDIVVTARPTTRVMFVTVIDADPGRAVRLSEALTDAYLQMRGEYLAQRRDQVLADLHRQLAQEAGQRRTVEIDGDNGLVKVRVEDLLLEQLQDITLSGTTPGEILRPADVSEVRRPIEVWTVSGLASGFLVGLVVVWLRQPVDIGETPARRRRR